VKPGRRLENKRAKLVVLTHSVKTSRHLENEKAKLMPLSYNK
jgi:hypothetical protein